MRALARTWDLAKLALEGARRTPLRLGLTAAGVAIATGALVSMVGFALGLQREGQESFRQMEILQRIQVQPGETLPLTDDTIARLAALPHVAAAYPHFRLADIEIRRGDRTERGLALGLPSEGGGLGYLRGLLVAGRLFERGAVAEALIAGALARRLGFGGAADAVGQAIVLRARGLTPEEEERFQYEEREATVTVAGVFEPPAQAFHLGGDVVLLPIELIRELPGSRYRGAFDRLKRGHGPEGEGYSQVIVVAERPSHVLGIEKSIRELGYATTTLLGRSEEMKRFFLVLEILLAAVGSVALVVAGLGILNTLIVAVLERTTEIGVYKAIGASDGDIRTIFLVEALVVGLAGGLGGLALGRAVSWLLGFFVNAYAGAQGVETRVAVFHFPAWLLWGALLFATLVSVAGGLYPAARAARIDPIRALRSN